MLPIRRALLSVTDKTGLVALATALAAQGVELISTGGTAKTLSLAGLKVRDVSELTQFPEIMDGRVKTLHPAVHGALLAIRGNPDHEAARAAHNISTIDLLVVNLYAFEESVKAESSWENTIENIDVGGPAMIRAAAKNHNDVTVIVEPGDYQALLDEMNARHGETSLDFRRHMAAKAFARTASYDAAIANWFARELENPLTDFFSTGGKKIQTLRYGENPQQVAAVYHSPDQRRGVAHALQLQGKELSYNNLNDTDAALDCVSEFGESDRAACVIVKHANPCGVALAHDLHTAYARALACDPTSAFGGILAFNRELDAATAHEIAKLFTEVIIAPSLSDDAKEILATKKNLRLLLLPQLPALTTPAIQIKSIIGALLVQSRDVANIADMDLQVVTRRQPTESEWRDLKFAFRVAKHVKSNAIVYVKDEATVGIGAGQMSRIDSSRIAVLKSGDAAQQAGLPKSQIQGSVVASDAFFPFADGLLQAAEAGATAVIHPGGSIRDAEIVAAADAAGLAMVLTGVRHFRH